MEAGATEMAAAAGVLCLLDAGLDALLKAMQPALERAAKSKRASERIETALVLRGLDCVACFTAPLKHSFVVMLFM